MRYPITFSRQLLPVEAILSMRDSLRLDPHYQRQGDVWSRPRQRLLIDSLLNGFAVPPMYWHVVDPSSEYFDGLRRYAVVDGRQRLEALFRFFSDELKLSAENALLADPSVDLAGASVADLRERVPWLFATLMRTQLEVVVIDTPEVDLIEELFSRLNEGVPLTAAEKRNRGRILAPSVRAFAERHKFFTVHLPFGNRRYRHYDLIAKFMRIEDRGLADARVPDLKKLDLDRLFERLRSTEENDPEGTEREVDGLLENVSDTLDKLTTVSSANDPYLSSVGMVTLYYAIARYFAANEMAPLDRREVEHFETLRDAVRGREEEDLDEHERLAVEFARYAQGPTSGSYLTARLRIFLRVERNISEGDDPFTDTD